MQIAFTNAMKEHNTYMQESDKKMLAEMKEQAEKDRIKELRNEELDAFKDSMALLASAIAGRAKPITQPAPVNQPPNTLLMSLLSLLHLHYLFEQPH